MAALVALAVGGGCIPEGPATTERSTKPAPSAAATPLGTKGGAASTKPATTTADLLGAPFEDRFERTELGANWVALSAAWRIDEGELCGKGARNRGVWLKPAIPTRCRIEFEARSDSSDGDIKAEVWGDGKTGATGSSYDNATSYLLILGGWQNSRHVLARLDEHGKDRLELETDPEAADQRALPVEPGRVYRFRVERADDATVAWWVDDQQLFELNDPAPLSGAGHDHFGFNDWSVRVCFDNLKITPL